MVVVGSIGNPLVESVAAFGTAPFVPCYFSAIVVCVNVGRVRSIEMPFTDVSCGVSCLFQYITPADGFGR